MALSNHTPCMVMVVATALLRGRWRTTPAPIHTDVDSLSLKTVKTTCDGKERASIARFPLGVAVVYFRGRRVEPGFDLML